MGKLHLIWVRTRNKQRKTLEIWDVNNKEEMKTPNICRNYMWETLMDAYTHIDWMLTDNLPMPRIYQANIPFFKWTKHVSFRRESWDLNWWNAHKILFSVFSIFCDQNDVQLIENTTRAAFQEICLPAQASLCPAEELFVRLLSWSTAKSTKPNWDEWSALSDSNSFNSFITLPLSYYYPHSLYSVSSDFVIAKADFLKFWGTSKSWRDIRSSFLSVLRFPVAQNPALRLLWSL